MSELRNYQTAVNAYYTATGELPGSEGSSQIATENSCLAWANMMKEGVVDVDISAVNSNMDACQTATDNGINANGEVTEFNSENSPTSKLKGAIYAIGYNNDIADNAIFVVGNTGEIPEQLRNGAVKNSKTHVGYSAVTIKDARTVDEKMDDGKIDSGKMYSFEGGNDAGANVTCDYNDTDNELKVKCTPAIVIGL